MIALLHPDSGCMIELMNSIVVSMNVTAAVLVPEIKHGADIPKAANFVQVDKKCYVSHPYFPPRNYTVNLCLNKGDSSIHVKIFFLLLFFCILQFHVKYPQIYQKSLKIEQLSTFVSHLGSHAI